MRQLSNFINGRFVSPQSGEYFDDINPATGEEIARIPDSDSRDMDLAIQSSRYAFRTWSTFSARDRAAFLIKIAELIHQRARDLAQADCMDQGIPMTLAMRLDIPQAAEYFRLAATQSEHFESRVGLGLAQRVPVGVTGVIASWSLPLLSLSAKIAPALAFGNTVVIKPSELTPVSAHLLAEILMKAELPPGVCNIVHGRGEKAGAPLAAHSDVPLLVFTGSDETGQAIQRAVTPHLKKVCLELGAKNPTVIFADCDFDKMLEYTIRSSFLNQGELAHSSSRIYVEDAGFDRVAEALVGAARGLEVGDPLDRRTFMGPLISARHLRKVEGAIEQALLQGARLVCGGQRPSLRDEFAQGFFLNPAILIDVDSQSQMARDELFGPVVSLHRFGDEAEALRLANDSRYGLSATVWTENLARAQRMAKQLEYRTVWINSWVTSESSIASGCGLKASGLGNLAGLSAPEFFTTLKETYLCS